ncbi:hypothetical protein Sme01_02940 [Sphaerisporangium melleum]|uniref:Capsid maturation protease n=1 Tax=Sphaerisporangium melleum TaxID=321316 RepID=A0A917QP29_9ACTN|nr:hypothetical protein [Sphaerisporangium melleum]GGK61276.1 hypothetical protein GCM10007964_00480 [Sphaerisporangium melleum]GII67818.1 hypothetical protein Sme01_02940 [Sphaerisporangium melleum]
MTQQTRAADYQAAQRALSARLAERMGPLWDLIRLGAFATTVPLWIDAVVELLRQFARMSGTLAADYYDQERELSDARRLFVPSSAEIPDGKAEASLRWATKSLWVPESQNPPPIEDRLAAAEHLAEGVAQKIVADAGRDTIVEALTGDSEALGWARHTGPNACHFCALLCSRGAVYHSEATAGAGANSGFEGEGSYKFHDNCDCVVYPIFQGQKWNPPDYVREWDRLYAESTRGAYGTKGKLRAWRKAFEGRDE